MKYNCIKALKNGEIIKSQSFETPKGVYVITLIRYRRDIYFFKDLNGKIVECFNVSRRNLKPKETTAVGENEGTNEVSTEAEECLD